MSPTAVTIVAASSLDDSGAASANAWAAAVDRGRITEHGGLEVGVGVAGLGRHRVVVAFAGGEGGQAQRRERDRGALDAGVWGFGGTLLISVVRCDWTPVSVRRPVSRLEGANVPGTREISSGSRRRRLLRRLDASV